MVGKDELSLVAGQLVPVVTREANFRRAYDAGCVQQASSGGFSGSSTQIPELTMTEKLGILQKVALNFLSFILPWILDAFISNE